MNDTGPQGRTETVRALALEVVRRCRFPILGSVEGDRPRLRPVSPAWVDGFTVWVGSLRSSGKTEQIRANPNVELCFLDENHDQVRIAGEASEVRDRESRLDIWNRYSLLRKHFPDVDDPEFVLYVIRPLRVRFMKEWALSYEEVRP